LDERRRPACLRDDDRIKDDGINLPTGVSWQWIVKIKGVDDL